MRRTCLPATIVVLLVACAMLPSFAQTDAAEHVASNIAEIKLLEARNRVVRLNLTAVPLEELLPAIAEKGKFQLEVRGDIRSGPLYSLEQTTVRKVLAEIARRTQLTYIVRAPETLLAVGTVPAAQDGVGAPKRIEPSAPLRYPEDARQAGFTGAVLLQAVVRPDGSVDDILVLQGPMSYPSLTRAAVEAVQQWRYEPATLLKRPVSVYFTLKVSFTPELLEAATPPEDG